MSLPTTTHSIPRALHSIVCMKFSYPQRWFVFLAFPDLGIVKSIMLSFALVGSHLVLLLSCLVNALSKLSLG